jgi:glycosyltransferase involved in cell wall biosynthesis
MVTSRMGFETFSKYLDTKYMIIPYSELLDKYGVVASYLLRAAAGSLFFNAQNEDILYASSDFLPDVFPPLFAKLKMKQVRWVQMIHHLIPHHSIRQGSKIDNLLAYLQQRVLLSLVKIFADIVIVVNDQTKVQLKQLGFEDNKIVVVPNGINRLAIEKIDRKKGERYDGVFLGRLHESKGVFDLLNIWSIVENGKPNARLAIIGGGDEALLQNLKKSATQSNLRIRVFGFLEDKEAFSIVKASDVFLFPSYEEGFGIAVLEAMSCGLPVVAWNLVAYEAFESGGLVRVETGNIALFAHTVLRLLLDSQLRNRLSAQSLQLSFSYDWDEVANRELNFIGRMTDREAKMYSPKFL